VGTELNCFAAGKKLYDPDTHALLGTNERPSGRIQVTEVLTAMTTAKILGGESLQAGDTCRGDPESDGAGQHREPPPAGKIYSY
jgi:hypothetical protein